jgi:hypothetical protein
LQRGLPQCGHPCTSTAGEVSGMKIEIKKVEDIKATRIHTDESQAA